MSKLQEKIDLYTEEVKKLGLKVDIDLLTSVAKGLGPSLYKTDSEKVSSSDTKELETVKKNFLIKKMGLEDSPKLDDAIAKAIETLGSSNRNKYRALFYTLLVQDLGLASKYDTEEVEVKKEPKKKVVKKEVVAEKVVVEDVKVEAATKEVEKEVVVETAKKESKKESKKEEKIEIISEEKAEDVPQNTQAFLDSFDWHKYEEGIEAVDEKQLAAFDKALEGIPGLVAERQVIDGTVIRMTDREAIIDINSKSEGVISLNEFRYNPSLAEGDIVEVLVDKREDSTGQLVLSHRKARVIKAWERVNNAFETQEVVTGFVKCRTKGGMIVDVFGIEAFLPGSQIDVKPIRDYDQYVEKTMEFKVVKINHEFKNVVVSHKALIEADIELQKREIIGQLEKGQVLEGIVKNITSYGVFVDLGGVDGLVHITDLSWSRINHPSEIVELDQKIKCCYS